MAKSPRKKNRKPSASPVKRGQAKMARKPGARGGKPAPKGKGRARAGKPKAKAGKSTLPVMKKPRKPPPPMAPLGVAGRDPSGKSLKFAVEAARLMSDLKCTEVQLLDIRGKSGMADYLIVASGTSDRQMRSVADAVGDLGATMDHPAFRTDADQRNTWVVLDCVDVVVHLFEPSTRVYYDLETMWGDAPRLKWEREAGEAAPGLMSRPRTQTRYEDGAPAN